MVANKTLAKNFRCENSFSICRNFRSCIEVCQGWNLDALALATCRRAMTAEPCLAPKKCLQLFVVIEPEPMDDRFRSFWRTNVSSTMRDEDRNLSKHQPRFSLFCLHLFFFFKFMIFLHHHTSQACHANNGSEIMIRNDDISSAHIGH